MIDWDAPDPKPNLTPAQLAEIRTTADALKLLDEWITAYRRLERELDNATFRAECAESLASNYEALYAAALDPANDDIRDRLSLTLRPA